MRRFLINCKALLNIEIKQNAAMIKRLVIISLILATGLGLALLSGFFSGNGSVNDRQYRDAFRRNYKIFALHVPAEAAFAGEAVPLNIYYVREALDRELLVNTYWHNKSVLLFKRAYRWFPLIEPILEQHGIPDDFKYLAVIESDLLNAVSPSGATGFWQFLEGTAKDHGLEVNNKVDERYHPEKSTIAACSYLRESYGKFGNWTLVAAAYNAGNRRIAEALEKQKVASCYDLHLNEETSRYVFRILALKILFENPTAYGFFLREKDFYPPLPVRTVVVDRDIPDLVEFALRHGITYKTLKLFNPWLRAEDLKVKKGRTYTITIPEADYTDYDALIRRVPDVPLVFGDTLLFEEL